MKFNLPSRKEMNVETMQNLVSDLSEYIGGDYIIYGELFWSMFEDLSAKNQEYYIRVLKDKLKKTQL